MTLNWLVLYLTRHKEVQDRCRKEIREVIGDNKCGIEDIQRLPYTQNKTSVKVEGSTIPSNSRFMANLHFIMRDPRHFQDPEVFNPDRFIGEDGRYKSHPALVPFGFGKRRCMMEALARNELMLFTVGLIQRLTFLPPDSGPMPDPQDYYVSITRMPSDFSVKIVLN